MNRMTNFLGNFILLVRLVRRSRLTPEFKTLTGKLCVALVTVTLVIVIEGIALWHVSGGTDENISNPTDGIYFAVASIFGETSSPATPGGRIITLIALSEGLILATYLIAVSAFFTIRGGRIMTRSHKDHYVICGWNFQGPLIVQELLNARNDSHFDIVVLPGEEVPVVLNEFGSKIFIVKGSPTEDRTLNQGDVRYAKRAIILTDTTLSPNNADAKVLMITLAVETMNPQVYTCAQLQNSENEIHLQRANVDETIPFDVLGANLSVASALNPGITRMVSELVHFDEGSEFYKLNPPLPNDVIGASFRIASSWFSEREMILVGVESNKLRDSYGTDNESELNMRGINRDRKGVFVNPKSYTIASDDALYVISDDDPELTLSNNS